VKIPIDERRLQSIISDIRCDWPGKSREERLAMDFAIRSFHEFLKDKKDCT